jgi:hypothetical protein
VSSQHNLQTDSHEDAMETKVYFSRSLIVVMSLMALLTFTVGVQMNAMSDVLSNPFPDTLARHSLEAGSASLSSSVGAMFIGISLFLGSITLIMRHFNRSGHEDTSG